MSHTQILQEIQQLPVTDQLNLLEGILRSVRGRLAVEPQRVVRLGGLWEGYTFDEDEIRAARLEMWSGLGKDFDE